MQIDNRTGAATRSLRHVLGLLLVAGNIGIAQSAVPALSWAATKTQAMPLSGATLLGSMDDNATLHIVVGLAMRDPDGAKSLLVSQSTPGNPAFGKFLTPEQYTANYSATSDSAIAVEQYLVAEGFTQVNLASNRLYVEAMGTPAVVQAAFNTTLARYRLNGVEVFTNTSAAQVPSALSGIVTGVIGLQNAFPMQTFLGRKAGAGTAAKSKAMTAAVQLPPVTMTPAAFQTFYDVGDVPEATNTIVAIFTEGDMTQDLLDIAQFRSEQHLAPLNKIEVVQTGLPSTDTSGDGEWDMDIATSTGIAGNVKALLLYATTSLNDADLIPDFNHFVTDNIATVGNASFGGCTAQEMLAGGLDVYDPIFEQAAAQGQTVFASAGDVGSSCPVVGVANGVPGAGLPDQSYPASSPYVMGAGGTTLMVNSDNTYDMEISWDAGGGGLEPLEFSPFWQVPVEPTGAASGATSVIGGLPVNPRGVPDVAMDADFLLSPAAYVLDGADTSNGGTSLASPLSTGCFARLQSRDFNQLGNAGPLYYSTFIKAGLPTSTTIAMHDIIVGANGAYTALPGYDYTTGIGTCDIAAMAALLPTLSAAPVNLNVPTAILSADTSAGVAPLTVTFDGSQSTTSNSGATVISYTFNFGDGTSQGPQSDSKASHTYTVAGTYDATLTVTDSDNDTSTNNPIKTIVATSQSSTSSAPASSNGGASASATSPALLAMFGLAALASRPRRRSTRPIA